ncbi:hypothetical protein D1BOALGB6SA_5149 [Olavius sp. associated proteobacterium Delta 1]|nr:hypothetical protein D1BOALGB6SA_5149 [Olavius sp. associated proteobacterium Delta 1]
MNQLPQYFLVDYKNFYGIILTDMNICFKFFKKEKPINPVHSDSVLARASSLSGLLFCFSLTLTG